MAIFSRGIYFLISQFGDEFEAQRQNYSTCPESWQTLQMAEHRPESQGSKDFIIE